MSEEEEAAASTWLTVPEAARELGLSERSLRRILKAPEHRQATQAGTRRERRQTNTGARDATVLAPAFVEALKARLLAQAGAENGGTNTGTEHRQNGGTTQAGTVAGTPANTGTPPFEGSTSELLTAAGEMRLAVVYERLIQSKDAEIGRLVARVEALEGALQREQENTARAQTLQAMQPQELGAAPVAQEAAQSAPEVESAQVLVERVPEPQQAPGIEGRARAWERSKGLRGWLLRLLRG